MNEISRIANALEYIDDELISRVADDMHTVKGNKKRYGIIAAAACLCVIAAVFGWAIANKSSSGLVDIPNTDKEDIVINEPVAGMYSIFDIKCNYLFRGESNLIPMTRSELCEHYGFDPMNAVPNDYEEFEYPPGFYRYDDCVDDLNAFVYKKKNGDGNMTFCVSKNEIVWLFNDIQQKEKLGISKIGGVEMYIFHNAENNDNCYCAIFEMNGCNISVSACNVEENVFLDVLRKLVENS